MDAAETQRMHDLLDHEEVPAPRTCSICRRVDRQARLEVLVAEQLRVNDVFGRPDHRLALQISKLKRSMES